jgi:hypothetical protein
VTRFLLDTSAVIEPPTTVRGSGDEYVVSAVTIAELNVGIHQALGPVELTARVGRLQWLARSGLVLPFTESAAQAYGQLYAMVIAAGRNPRRRQMDLLIASVAAANQLPLLTRNAEDFADLTPLIDLVDLQKQD